MEGSSYETLIPKMILKLIKLKLLNDEKIRFFFLYLNKKLYQLTVLLVCVLGLMIPFAVSSS